MMKRQISGGAILSFLSQFIGIIVGLVYTPVMIKILGQNEYGLYQLVQSVVNYLNLMNFGFNGAYIRYFSLAKNKKEDKAIADVNGMFMNVFMLIGVLCLAAGVVLFFNIGILGSHLTTDDYSIAKKLLVIMVLNLAISFPNSLFVAFMSANERFVFQKVINILNNILLPTLTLPLLFLGFGSVGVVFITFFLNLVRLFVNIIYCLKKLQMKISIGYFDKTIFIGLLGYTFFIFLSDLVDQMNSNVDKFLLGRLTGTIAVALYSVGFNLKTYYTTMSWIVPELYVPEANRLAINEKNDNKLTEIFTNVGRFNNYIVLLVLTGFILVGKSFIVLWVGPEYETAYYAGVILMISGYIPAVQTLGVNIQNAKNMHKIRSVVYFGVACINVVSSIFLIKQWGVIGTCLGTLFATLLGHGIFMNYYYHKKVGLNIVRFWKKIIRWLIPVIILTTIGKIVLIYLPVNSWITLFAFAFGYSFIYLIMLAALELKADERKKIIDKLIKR